MWLVDVVAESSCNIIFYSCLEAVNSLYYLYQFAIYNNLFQVLTFSLQLVHGKKKIT
jgi:hypothetical protein